MTYDFTRQLKNYEYIEFIKYGLKYYIDSKPNQIISYEKTNDLPDKIKKFIASEYDTELNRTQQTKFELSNGFWGYERCRYGEEKKDNYLETEFYTGVVESRTNFLKYALYGIDIKPNSLEKTGLRKVTMKSINGENVDIVKETRGTGNEESLDVYVTSDNKSMKIGNITSGYTIKHIVNGHPDIYEDIIQSRNESYGCVLTPDGLYIFSGDFRKKSEDETKYTPNFEVNFYNIESLNIMCGEYYNDKEGRNVIREEINKGCKNGKYLQSLIDETGILPDDKISIECKNEEIVTLANAIYKEPQQFLQYYKESQHVM